MNHDLPMTFGVESDGVDLPRHSFMRLPRQRLHLVASVWIASNCLMAMSYASGLIEANKVLDHLWLDALLGLALLGALGLLFGLLGQVERLEEHVARKSASRGRGVHLTVLFLLLCACVTASLLESRAVKASDDRLDARPGVLRQAAGS
jgi:hypothetical protein